MQIRSLTSKFLALVLFAIPLLATAANSSLVVKDANGSTQTLSQGTDAANSSYLMGVSTIADATNGYKAAVKTASTAAAAADPALVVTLSPNNGVGGTAAVGAAAAGSPVQSGGIYNTTPATITNGQVGALQLDGTQNLLVAQKPATGNPCANPNVTLTTVSGATTGTAATQVIALSGSTVIYVCNAWFNGVSGTTPTFSLVYGTGSNCATGQTVIVPATATAAGSTYNLGAFVAAPAGKALCYLDAGTTPVQNYLISFVQQ